MRILKYKKLIKVFKIRFNLNLLKLILGRKNVEGATLLPFDLFPF